MYLFCPIGRKRLTRPPAITILNSVALIEAFKMDALSLGMYLVIQRRENLIETTGTLTTGATTSQTDVRLEIFTPYLQRALNPWSTQSRLNCSGDNF